MHLQIKFLNKVLIPYATKNKAKQMPEISLPVLDEMSFKYPPLRINSTIHTTTITSNTFLAITAILNSLSGDLSYKGICS